VQHRYHITWLPGPATAVLIGVVLGLLIRVTADEGSIPDELSFSGIVFFLILLPIIIFQAGYSLRKKEFFGQLFTILFFSIAGTILSAFIIGLILYGAGTGGYTLELSFNEAMAYASILSATDAVAVANLYRALDVADPMLTIMIYGEGSVNDAASIVMYQTFSSFIEEGVSDEGIATAGEHFAAELFGSIGMGILIAVLATFAFRIVHMGWVPAWAEKLPCCPRSRGPRRVDPHLADVGSAYDAAPLLTPSKAPNAVPGGAAAAASSAAAAASSAIAAAGTSTPLRSANLPPRHTPGLTAEFEDALTRDDEIKPDSSVFAQTSFILTMGYVAYMAAEASHLSGVVAVLFAGIGLNHFVRPLMTKEGKDFSEGTIRVLAEIADMACFFQVGLDMALNFGTNRGIDTKADASLVGFVLLGIFLGRAVAVFGLSFLLNYYRREPVPASHQVMLWHAGLRGAGAYAFALVFPTHNKEVLVDITAAIIFITVLACGATTTRMLTAVGVPWGHHALEAGAHGGGEHAGHGAGGHGGDGHGAASAGYRTVMVQGARVRVPVGDTRFETAAARRDKTVTWINSWDTKVRYWVSGVVRQD
jgi:NhaP-type Na+/H+ or K+/H+ antiporter